MLGLFDTLNLATRALQTQQTGVAVAGQNLANVNNPAYARQRVNLQTSDAIDTGFGPEGTGVEVAGIQQIRDNLLDAQIRSEASVGSFWQTTQGALQDTQTELGQFLSSSVDGTGSTNSGSSQGLSDQIAGLFNSFQAVAASPASLTQRQALVNQAQTLAGALNQASTRLSAVTANLNTSVSNDVESANQLLSDIAGLNGQITQSEAASGGQANDLRDLREQKLEALANLGNFQASTASDGTLGISLDGNTLVSGSQQMDSLQSYDSGGGRMLVRLAGAGTALSFSGGSIGGAISARDGAVADLNNGLNALASQLITQVNSVYASGYDLKGNTGAQFFTGTDAATIGINNALINDPSLVQAAGSAGAPGDNTVALSLAQLASQPVAALGNQTFAGAYGQLVQNLGDALSNANDQVASSGAVGTLLANQRDSVSGVSMEEEMTNLVTFQKSYEASAQVMATVNQMLQTLISIKTP